MIAQLDIYLNAAAPSLPLPVWDAFVGSPSHLRIFNVPQNIGSWRLTKIYVSVKYPDNAIRSVECTKHVGGRIWSATVSGCSTPGFAERGYEIQADGVDEHGEPVTGYVLGAGDVFICDRDGSVTVGETTYYFHLRDAVPATPKKSDVCVVDGVLKYYTGTAWQPFAVGGSPIDIVAPSTDPAGVGKAADAKATGDALAGKRGMTDLGVRGAPTPDNGGVFIVNGVAVQYDASMLGWNAPNALINYSSFDGSYHLSGPFDSVDFTISASNGYRAAIQSASEDIGSYEIVGILDTLAMTASVQRACDAVPVRYDRPSDATAISSASSEVVEGETVTYGEATLADRTANRVAITAAIAELRLAFPAAVSGKVRDFGLRVEVGDGTAALTAPALVPPAGVTLENADGTIPALADGTATAAGVTLLYFSETAPGVFLVKGEEVKEA